MIRLSSTSRTIACSFLGNWLTKVENLSSLAVPAPVVDAVPCEQTATGELLLRSGPRVWRDGGWQENTVAEVMKINVQMRDETSLAFHVDQLDMFRPELYQRSGRFCGVAITRINSAICRCLRAESFYRPAVTGSGLPALLSPAGVPVRSVSDIPAVPGHQPACRS